MASHQPGSTIPDQRGDPCRLLGLKDGASAENFVAAVARDADADADALIAALVADLRPEERASFARLYPDPVAEHAALLIAVSWRRLRAIDFIKSLEAGPGESRH